MKQWYHQRKKNILRKETNTKHELKRKQLEYKAMDTTKKQDMLNKKQNNTKQWTSLKKTRSFKQKSRIQNNGHC